MKNTLCRLEGPAYAALRIVAGSMFACHGMQKLFGWFGAGSQPAIGTQIWVGGLIELVGGLLITIGLFTRAAAFLAAGMMAVAYFQFHWKLQIGGWKWLPVVNRGELAVLYCFVFLLMAARGPGAASVDRMRGRG